MRERERVLICCPRERRSAEMMNSIAVLQITLCWLTDNLVDGRPLSKTVGSELMPPPPNASYSENNNLSGRQIWWRADFDERPRKIASRPMVVSGRKKKDLSFHLDRWIWGATPVVFREQNFNLSYSLRCHLRLNIILLWAGGRLFRSLSLWKKSTAENNIEVDIHHISSMPSSSSSYIHRPSLTMYDLSLSRQPPIF